VPEFSKNTAFSSVVGALSEPLPPACSFSSSWFEPRIVVALPPAKRSALATSNVFVGPTTETIPALAS
jgi:hypothetical protein